MDKNLFDFEYRDNNAAKTIFLLHGTGGSKNDLLFLDDFLEKKYNLVSLQGNILENGLPRFFKRHAVGVFDQQSLTEETEKLHNFISGWQKEYRLTPENTIGLGYSNGANILLSLVINFPGTLFTLYLLHAMMPFSITDKVIDFTRHSIYLTLGKNDPLISYEQQQALVSALQAKNTKLISKQYPSGHKISEEEMSDLKKTLV